MITLPVGVYASLCVYQHVRRKWGAVGVRAASCWWEWDKNLFPLLKPSALSEDSVFFYNVTYTKKNRQTQMYRCTQRFAENRKKWEHARAVSQVTRAL